MLHKALKIHIKTNNLTHQQGKETKGDINE